MLRVLAALCRQSGGELRISGAEVDRVGEATSLIKEWDADHQQVVLRVETIGFREVFRLTPERQTPQVLRATQTVDPVVRPAAAPASPNGEDFLPKRSLLDQDSELVEMAKKRNVARAAATLRQHLREQERKRQAEQERIDL